MFASIPDFSRLRIVDVGGVTVTLGGVITGALLAAMFLGASWLIGAALRRLRNRVRQGRAALYVTEKVLTYGLAAFGLVAGLSTIGLDLSSLAVFAGAIGIGLGLGLQGVVKEFISGLVLIFDDALQIGDYVELNNGVRGIVHEVGPRAARIRNNDNIDTLVPNSYFVENPVTNWTRKGETRRIHIPFAVAYGADKEKVRACVLAAANAVSFTMPETELRKSQVWLTGFGDSSLNFELLVWPTLEAVKRPRAMHAAYTWAIDDALRKAGIEIPFPQRDVRLRSFFGEEGEDALAALKLDKPRHARTPVHTPSVNDAAEDLMRPPPPEDAPPSRE